MSSWFCLSDSEGGLGHVKEHKQSVAYGKYSSRLMWDSSICGFSLMKSEYHDINIVPGEPEKVYTFNESPLSQL